MTVLAMTDHAPRAQHHAGARRRGRAGCARKHAFASRRFRREGRRAIEARKPQVGSGAESGSGQGGVGSSSFYDPTTGQYVSRDPLAPLTRSAYGYVYGNPLNATDPSGLYCVTGVKGHDGNGDEVCNGAGEIADNEIPDAVSVPLTDLKDAAEENGRNARTNSSVPSWARLGVKVSTAVLSMAMVEAACSASAAAAPETQTSGSLGTLLA